MPKKDKPVKNTEPIDTAEIEPIIKESTTRYNNYQYLCDSFKNNTILSNLSI